MTTAKGYTEMKDSGIQWIGAIPAHWDILRGKNVLRLLERPVKPEDDVVTCFRDGEVTLRKNRREEGFTNSLKEIGYQGIEPGDLIVHGMDGFAGAIGISDSRGKASPVLNVMDSNQNKRYLMYYLRAMAYKDVFMALSTGIRVRSCDLRWNKLSVFPFLIPKSHEQSAIAAYLDTQCAKIDEIIAQAKASIEDYKQWKASIIYEAVTKGLDPNVEMKDSGVEWIGEVPMRWKIVRLKYLLSTPLQYGANETGLPYDESLPRYIRITDITLDGKLKTSGMQSLSEEKSEGYILDDEDILLARSGATVGKAFYYRESYGKAAFAGYLIRAKINSAKALPKFIYYSTMSAGYEKWKETAVIQATIQNIGASRYNEYSLAIPPIAEQLRIIEFLDDKMEKIDSLMAEKQSLIDDLESYKKSLIYEVVTGKRRV